MTAPKKALAKKAAPTKKAPAKKAEAPAAEPAKVEPTITPEEIEREIELVRSITKMLSDGEIAMMERAMKAGKMLSGLTYDRLANGSVPLIDVARLTGKVSDYCDAVGTLKSLFEKFHAFLVRGAMVTFLTNAKMNTATVNDEDGTKYRLDLRPDVSISVNKDGRVEMTHVDEEGTELTTEQIAERGLPAVHMGDFTEWLRRNGKADLVQETVNASSLKAAIKAMIKDGNPPPEELFTIKPADLVAMTVTAPGSKK